MNKYQEALKVLYENIDCSNNFYLDNLISENLEIISELVDKATPKKTKTKMNEHNHIDRHCPICDSFVYSFDIYCGKCGQRIRSEE